MEKRGGLLIALMFFVVMNAFFVRGFGIAAPYFENNTIKLSPGQSFEYTFSIQNGDEESYNVSVNVTSDLIVHLRQDNTFIKSKTYNNTFTIDITVPKGASIGKIHTVGYTARPILGGGGQVPVTVELPKSVNVLVVPEGESVASSGMTVWNVNYSKYSYYIYGLVGIIILVLVYFIVRRLWNLSINLSENILGKKAPYAISDAKNLDEIIGILKIISQKEYSIPEIKNILVDRLKSMGSESLGSKILSIDKKSDAISALTGQK